MSESGDEFELKTATEDVKGANASYKLTKKPTDLLAIGEFENRILDLATNPFA